MKEEHKLIYQGIGCLLNLVLWPGLGHFLIKDNAFAVIMMLIYATWFVIVLIVSLVVFALIPLAIICAPLLLIIDVIFRLISAIIIFAR